MLDKNLNTIQRGAIEPPSETEMTKLLQKKLKASGQKMSFNRTRKMLRNHNAEKVEATEIVHFLDKYIVHVYHNEDADEVVHDEALKGKCSWLSFRRIDNQPVTSWQDVQHMKNHFCGEDREAFQMHPAEARLVDTANQYHLFVLPVGVAIGFGWRNRLVVPQEVQ